VTLLRQLWRLEGTVGRATYALGGLFAFALKFAVDWSVAHVITGTTWYQHNLWPAAYWRLWSDEIIHRIHMRVLRHILKSSET